VEARTATGGFFARRPIAVTRPAPVALTVLTSLLFMVLGMGSAQADTSGPSQAGVASIKAKINDEAVHIHQLTEDLDQARLQVTSTEAQLVSVTRQVQAAVQGLAANRSVLVDQALRAYMQGGVTMTMESSSDSPDLTVSQEYLRVASGDVADTGDQLHLLETNLSSDEVSLQGAQHASVSATTQLQALRNNALSVAASDQVQLDSLQAQLNAQAAAQAQQAAQARSVRTQGVPVNNGLITVIQQAAGLPIATSVATTPGRAPVVSVVGSLLGGVWLALRTCESSDNYSENTGNGFFGAYQFSQSTWTGLGFPGRPDQESPAMQDEAAQKDQAQSGWGQWPACAAALGLL